MPNVNLIKADPDPPEQMKKLKARMSVAMEEDDMDSVGKWFRINGPPSV